MEQYRSRRNQVTEEVESKDDAGSDKEFGTRSKVSLLDQHSELKKKAEGNLWSKRGWDLAPGIMGSL